MKKSIVSKLACLVVSGAVIGTAAAQSNGPSGISVRVGAFFPTNNLAQDLSSTWFVFGADLKLTSLSALTGNTGMGYFGISADYYYHGSDSDIPVALTYNYRQGQFVYSAGIGPEFRDFGDLTDTGVGVAEQLGVSYDLGTLPTPVFLQAKYFFSSKPELSGLGVYVGVRF